MKKFEKLSRAEMKNVLGGVFAPPGGGGGDDCTDECSDSKPCPTGKTCTAFKLDKSCPDHPTVYICG